MKFNLLRCRIPLLGVLFPPLQDFEFDLKLMDPLKAVIALFDGMPARRFHGSCRVTLSHIVWIRVVENIRI